MNSRASYPRWVTWMVTYRCPLQCIHCHTESGRRPARQLSDAEARRFLGVLQAMRLDGLTFSGGEPLSVPWLHDVAEALRGMNREAVLYTSGWPVTEANAARTAAAFSRIHVSIDGATAAVHDAIRGRPGSFDRALRALELLDRHRSPSTELGIDVVVLRSNFHQLRDFCAQLAARFKGVDFIALGAVVPSGMASRASFAEVELLLPEQMQLLDAPDTRAALQELVPGTRVSCASNFNLRLPEGCWFVQPDGAVQAMPIYEGSVGSLLEEPPEELWRRCEAVRGDPFVRDTLASIRSVTDWAGATRAIDMHLASAADAQRIQARPEFTRVDS